MKSLTDKNHKPELDEINEYIQNPLFAELREYLETRFGAQKAVEYSGDSLLPGWNVRFFKAGRSLCRVYPEKGSFTVLVVVGKKEKERAEALLPQMSETVREIYANTKEGMGQRLLMIRLFAADAAFEDVKTLVRLRRER